MDDFSSGAYAFFGPGQFRSLYPHLVRPAADSRFHIVGEAASVLSPSLAPNTNPLTPPSGKPCLDRRLPRKRLPRRMEFPRALQVL